MTESGNGDVPAESFEHLSAMDAEIEYNETKREIRRLEARAQRLCSRFNEAHHGVKVGSIVRITSRIHYDKLALVTSVHNEISTRIRPWLHARLQKKDGTYRTADQLIFTDWEVVDPQPPVVTRSADDAV